MKNACLIAAREYAENAKTKGFWLGLFLFPVLFLVMMKVPRILEEKATPARHFVLVDQSGKMKEALQRALEANHRRAVAQELFAYLKRHAKAPQKMPMPDLEKISGDAFDPEKILEEYGVSLDTIAQELAGKDLAAYLDQSAAFLQEGRPPFAEPRLRFVRLPLPEWIPSDAEPKEIAQKLRPYLLNEKKLHHDGQDVSLFALVVIPEDVEDQVVRPAKKMSALSAAGIFGSKPRGVEYWCTNLADDELPKLVENAVNEEIRAKEYLARNLSKDQVLEVQGTRAAFSRLNPKKEAGKEAVSLADKIRQWAPVGFVYVLWIAILSIATMLLNNTVEEKSNRLVEVLLSSVTPGELMAGKLLGIAGIGLTMLAVWIGSLFGVLHFYAQQEKEMVGAFLEVLSGSGLLPAFAFYFLIGYLMYGGIFLSIGSLCNTVKEAQNFMGPMMTVMMVPLITMVFIPKDPNGTLAQILSWIPFYSPFIMMNRAAADPPMFDVVGTTVLMIGFTAGLLWLAGRIFRVGILRTGQPPKIMELFRWIRSKA